MCWSGSAYLFCEAIQNTGDICSCSLSINCIRGTVSRHFTLSDTTMKILFARWIIYNNIASRLQDSSRCLVESFDEDEAKQLRRPPSLRSLLLACDPLGWEALGGWRKTWKKMMNMANYGARSPESNDEAHRLWAVGFCDVLGWLQDRIPWKKD